MIGRRFVVAGGAGFIGSHFVRSLLSSDQTERVTVLDNLCSGSLKNLSDIQDDSRLRILECDITEPLPVLQSPDTILHLASFANPKDYETHPLETLLVNSKGNENLLDLANRSRSRYVYFSSSEVYGNHNPLPNAGLSENCLGHLHLGHSRSCYSTGKVFGEEYVRTACSKMALDCLIVRPFNIYGPNMDINAGYGRVIPNFLKWAQSGMSLQINGDGRQERSFCYIDDFVDCMMRLLDTDFRVDSVVNIGNPEPVKIIELAELVNRITGNPSGVTFSEGYPYEPRYRTPNINKVREWIGWEPLTSLKEGVTKMLESFSTEETGGEVRCRT